MSEFISLRFKPGFTSPTLEVAHGSYLRMFDAGSQPFTVSSSEYEQHLARLNVFDVEDAQTTDSNLDAAQPASKTETVPVAIPAASMPVIDSIDKE